MGRTLVLYHGGCRDGFCAAWVMYLVIGDSADYLAVNHGEPPPDLTSYTNVYIVDFSYPRPVMEAMLAEGRNVHVLDHHKTAEEALRGLPGVVFDVNRSGAGLAWDYLTDGHGETGKSPRPLLVDYVEDRDLWRFKLDDSKAVNAWIGTLKYDFGEWDRASHMLGGVGGQRYAAEMGKLLLDKVAQYVAEVRRNERMIFFPSPVECHVPIVNAPHPDISELLHAMCQEHPFSVGWSQRADGKFVYSLRSREDAVDVSVIAKHYGGGGHAHAAGFTSDTLLF